MRWKKEVDALLEDSAANLKASKDAAKAGDPDRAKELLDVAKRQTEAAAEAEKKAR
jgi:hypothetical protein